MDSEENFIDSDMMLYVIGPALAIASHRVRRDRFVDGLVDVANVFWIKVALKWYSNRDLAQLICWFDRILLLTIEV
ncbi:hypothetical protein V1477_021164 [Vespula maculifrons]|uniref:Uncharacterized protein n=1 Tax=Vespula maculifrons TaxID=7453 RepID=A0ABD2AGX9_VESMC